MPPVKSQDLTSSLVSSNPKGRDRNKRGYDPDYRNEQTKNKNRAGQPKDPFFRDQGGQFDMFNNKCRICPDDGSTKFAVKVFARAAAGAGFGFYANVEKEIYSTEELTGWVWQGGYGVGVRGVTAEVGLGAQLADVTFPLVQGSK